MIEEIEEILIFLKERKELNNFFKHLLQAYSYEYSYKNVIENLYEKLVINQNENNV